jgi:acetyl-CoA C-acetyltransferase
MPDVYIAMDETAENVATVRGISREAQDRFAVESQQRAERAIADGFFARERTPSTLPDATIVAQDDGPRPGTSYEDVAALPLVFRQDGIAPLATALHSTTAPRRS